MEKKPVKIQKLKEKVLEALVKANGIVSDACKKVKINRKTFYDWVKTDKNFRDCVEDVNDVALDFVESKMFNAIKKGDGRMIQFFLSTKGKKRGYVTRQEIHEVRPPIIQITNDEADYFDDDFLSKDRKE